MWTLIFQKGNEIMNPRSLPSHPCHTFAGQYHCMLRLDKWLSVVQGDASEVQSFGDNQTGFHSLSAELCQSGWLSHQGPSAESD